MKICFYYYINTYAKFQYLQIKVYTLSTKNIELCIIIILTENKEAKMEDIIKYQGYPIILREFASYKRVIQGRSIKTVDEYMLDLRTFFRYLKLERGIGSIEKFSEIDISDVNIDFIRQIGATDIYEFLMFVDAERTNASSAVARKLSAIKGLFKYLTVTMHLLEDNPAINIESPKVKKSLPKHLSEEEAVDLLSTVKNNKENTNALRDYTILTLFLNCGMRLSELVGINLDRISSDLSSLAVIGKGNKERVIYLNDTCKEILSEYLTFRHSERFAQIDSKALFLSRNGNRIGRSTVQWLVKKHLDETGLQAKNYSTHKLRHTAATLMYQTGKVDVRVLKEILGHEQLNTTQIYTHVANSDIEKAMQENPLNTKKKD